MVVVQVIGWVLLVLLLVVVLGASIVVWSSNRNVRRMMADRAKGTGDG